MGVLSKGICTINRSALLWGFVSTLVVLSNGFCTMGRGATQGDLYEG